jgi:hypothetical protein
MNERRGIMSGCEYAIAKLNTIKKSLLNPDNSQNIDLWAIGSLIVILASNLISISDEVITHGVEDGILDSKADLREIQRKFNEFIDEMVGHE